MTVPLHIYHDVPFAYSYRCLIHARRRVVGVCRRSADFAVPAPPSPVTIDGRHRARTVSRDRYDAWCAKSARGRRTEFCERAPVREPSSIRSPVTRKSSLASAPCALRHRRWSGSRRSRRRRSPVEPADASHIGRAPARRAMGARVYAWQWPRGLDACSTRSTSRATTGRFAIDWVRQDEQGLTARGDADIVKNSLGYGATCGRRGRAGCRRA